MKKADLVTLTTIRKLFVAAVIVIGLPLWVALLAGFMCFVWWLDARDPKGMRLR